MTPSKPRRLLEGGGSGAEGEQMRLLLERLSADAPAEASSDAARRTRVWRALEAQSSPAPARVSFINPRARLWLAGGIAAFAMLAVLALSLRSSQPQRPAAVATAVPHLAAGRLFSQERELASGSTLPAGARLHTDGVHSGLLQLGDIAQLLLEPQGALAVDAPGAETIVRLAEGELVAQVTKRPEGHPFIVQLEQLRVRVVGTIFAVRVIPGGAEVSVSRGAVQVERGAQRWRVEAGQAWSSAAPDQRAGDFITEAQRALLQGAAGSAASPEQRESAHEPDRPGAGALAAPPPSPQPQPALPPPHGEALAPAAGHPRARATLPPASAVAAPPAAAVAISPSTPSPSIAAADAAPTTPAPRLALVDESDPYRKAEKLLARGQYSSAAQALEAIVAQGGAHRDLALYELGRVRQRSLNDLAGARQAFHRYQADYPGGSLAQEVELSLIDADLASPGPRERAAALDEVTAFLRAHPQSERASEMHLLRGNLLRERADCAGAIGDYAQVAHGAFAGDALYFTAFCEQRLGRSDAAKVSLRRYLSLFPSGEHRAEAEAALAERGLEH